MSNGQHSQKLLENELKGLLILAHALGVCRPCILEVRASAEKKDSLYMERIKFAIFVCREI